jgi:non-canonical purine NTP pyrophosphatase (RdgB/HAM1 family)
MKLNQITVVTGNKAKAKEIGRILNYSVEIVDLDLEEIQEIDLEKVARHKLNQAFEILKRPVIIDDVSFEVEAWNSFPGPLIKWILKAGGPELLLTMMKGQKNRNATARLAIGFHDGKNEYLFFGETKGVIAKEIRRDNGFGFDRLFIPEGYDKTYSELPPKVKDEISHRGRGLSKFKDFLKKNYDI